MLVGVAVFVAVFVTEGVTGGVTVAVCDCETEIVGVGVNEDVALFRCQANQEQSNLWGQSL